jgi:predicted RNA binding protein YcfA (HicA-like mRNA interferase family)
MKPVSGKQFCKVLERRGWILLRINASHHIYGRPDIPVILPVPVHSNRDLPTGTQRALCA